MPESNRVEMALTPEQLNDVDEAVLDLLDEGRVTPALAREQLAERRVTDVSRQYVNQRLRRLEEHGHVKNLLESGVYELAGDPRDEGE